jgi:uncharacterized protein
MVKKKSEQARVTGRSSCPICGKPVDKGSKSYPFCTDRCRLVDLGKWFSGGYTLSRPIEQRDLEEGQD